MRINNLEGDLVLKVDRSDGFDGDTSLSLRMDLWVVDTTSRWHLT